MRKEHKNSSLASYLRMNKLKGDSSSKEDPFLPWNPGLSRRLSDDAQYKIMLCERMTLQK